MTKKETGGNFNNYFDIHQEEDMEGARENLNKVFKTRPSNAQEIFPKGYFKNIFSFCKKGKLLMQKD
jgi:hypothetical protein